MALSADQTTAANTLNALYVGLGKDSVPVSSIQIIARVLVDGWLLSQLDKDNFTSIVFSMANYD